ncbi:MAG: hypothetical protein GF308_18200 [Candidatus Heimdallarchaeota archaeon]|nr:hypothetical protein [Candidatus Heimdallarchaeota archaeon]
MRKIKSCFVRTTDGSVRRQSPGGGYGENSTRSRSREALAESSICISMFFCTSRALLCFRSLAVARGDHENPPPTCADLP